MLMGLDVRERVGRSLVWRRPVQIRAFLTETTALQDQLQFYVRIALVYRSAN